MPVFEYADDVAPPRMYAYLLVRPASDVARIQSLTLRQPATGFQWLITQTAAMTVRDATWVTGARLAPEDPAGFDEGEYEVIYTDSSDRVSRLVTTLNYVPDYLTSTTATFRELMSENATAKLAVYDVEGQMLYFGPRSDDLADADAIKRRYPDYFSWREIVSPPNNAVAAVLPLHFADFQNIVPPLENEPPQSSDEPPDFGNPAVTPEEFAAAQAAAAEAALAAAEDEAQAAPEELSDDQNNSSDNLIDSSDNFDQSSDDQINSSDNPVESSDNLEQPGDVQFETPEDQ
jgi:hypothetical protein